MASASNEPTSNTIFDVYGSIDRLNEPILAGIAMWLEDRTNRPEFQCMMDEYLKAMQIDPDSQQGKTDEERLISILITKPHVMRQLPELLSRVDLDLMQHFGYVVSDVGRVNFWTSTLESFRKLLPASSAMAEEEADHWVDDRFSESDRGVFFCSGRFYSYIARKA